VYFYLICYFKVGLRVSHRLYLILGKAALPVTNQSNISPGRCVESKMASGSQCLGNRGYNIVSCSRQFHVFWLALEIQIRAIFRIYYNISCFYNLQLWNVSTVCL